MTVSLKHTKNSAIADSGDANFVQPSDWNAEHTLTLATGKLLGRSTAGTGAAEEITVGSGLSLSAGSLSATASGGTVTSVSFTGGLISVGTATTTPALTVAGTSGGIPYFSSASTWASSAALAANALVIGGGDGVAPSTTTTGTGVLTALGVNTGTAGAFVVNGGAGGTPSSLTLTNATGLPAAGGGTGQSSYTTGDLLYASGATTLSKLADVATGNVLISGGVGVAPSWGKVNVTTAISGILPSANGGTGMAFFTVSGPATTAKTFTFPNASSTVLTTNAAVTVAQGGTGLASGTSGGIPYFSSTTAMTSSALLAANALMIGGGAGAAPATTTTGTGVVTALGVNTGTAGAFVVNGGALGTPSSGTVTNLTGTASININGTVGATTPTTGSFTTITGSGLVNISAAGAGQIQFPAAQNASANANTLDDYEEGTWTPAYAFGGGTTGLAYTVQTGIYTKIGNIVTVVVVLQTSSKGSSTGSATLTGLPFSCAQAMGGTLGYVEKLTSVTFPSFYINSGTPTLMNLLSDAVGNPITDTNFAATSNFMRFSYSYNT